MKLDNKRTILVGFAFLAISAFWQVYDNIIPLILKYFFGIGDTLSGAIMALDNIFALIMLPIFGAWSDRISHRRGKRTPFIFIGTILAVIFMLMLPEAANSRNVIWFVGALFMTLISMSIFRSPAVSLMPDVTPKPLRSKGNAIINLMGAVGIIMALGLIMVLVGDGNTPDYEPLFISIAVIMVAALLIILFKVDENKMVAQRIAQEKAWGISDEGDGEEDEQKAAGKEPRSGNNAGSQPGSGNAKLPGPVKKSLIFLLLSVAFWYMAYNAVTTAFSKYATEMWGMEGGDFAGALMVASVGALVYGIQCRYHGIFKIRHGNVGNGGRRFCRSPDGGLRWRTGIIYTCWRCFQQAWQKKGHTFRSSPACRQLFHRVLVQDA